MNLQMFALIVALVLAASANDIAVAVTSQRFDVMDQGTPYCSKQTNNPPLPTMHPGGSTGKGKFLRLVSAVPEPVPPSSNTITFVTTDAVTGMIVADFDFRITAGESVVIGKGRGDGLGFALLNTEVYDDSGCVEPQGPLFAVEEPNFTGSIGVGFDIRQNEEHGDIGNEVVREKFSNSLSIHFDGKLVAQEDVTPIVDLAGGRWIHARIIMRPGGGHSDITVILTLSGCSPVILKNQLKVPEFLPYKGRVHFGARSGGETAHHDLDNIKVQFVPISTNIISFRSLTYSALEGGSVKITVDRVGDGQVSVQYSTQDDTAKAGEDYEAKTGTLVFEPGQASKTFRVGTIDDEAKEGKEVFKVLLSNPTGGAVLGGPRTTIVIIVDDETARSRGSWSKVMCWPLVAIHLHLLPTAKVLFWDRPGNHAIWDPNTKQFSVTAEPHPDYDIFCSGHSFLEDGKLLITGGHADIEGFPRGHQMADSIGVDRASTYDSINNRWEFLPPMNAGRWYPTNTPLADGTVLVLSGRINKQHKNLLPQIWQPKLGAWKDLTDAEDPGPLGVGLYPRVLLAPNNLAFKAGPDQDTWYLNTSEGGQWIKGPSSHFKQPRSYGIAAMYRPGKILIAGGGPDHDCPTDRAEIIDLNTPDPEWQEVAPMRFKRRQHNATVLPDGTVLVTGGSSGCGFNNETMPVYAAELFDPSTKTWMTLARMRVPRLYHSTALLLPDGRVLSAGGGQGGAASYYNNAEIYSPPYLFKGRRPTITSAPLAINYGEAFFVETPDAANAAKLSLIRLPSVTHSFDQNQRYLRLGFSKLGNGLEVSAPNSANVAPPGHYLLFVVSAEGVPSIAKIVQIVSSD
jgi:Domain of unknown function (DUF1929)/Calx-beta domain/Kelch motif